MNEPLERKQSAEPRGPSAGTIAIYGLVAAFLLATLFLSRVWLGEPDFTGAPTVAVAPVPRAPVEMAPAPAESVEASAPGAPEPSPQTPEPGFGGYPDGFDAVVGAPPPVDYAGGSADATEPATVQAPGGDNGGGPAPSPGIPESGTGSLDSKADADQEELPGPFWNTWIEDTCRRKTLGIVSYPCDGATTVARGADRNLVLSISAYALNPDLATETSERIAPLLAGPKGSLNVVVVPIFFDGQVEAQAGSDDSSFGLKITRPLVTVPTIAELRRKRKDTPQDLELHHFGREISSGEIEIPIHVSASSGPCAHVALSIWDNELRTALDSLLIPIAVDTGEPGRIGCGDPSEHRVLTGFDALTAVSRPHGRAGTATVGLHVFEFDVGTQPRSFAVLAERAGDEEWVGGWQLQSLMSATISEATGLPSGIKHARGLVAKKNSEAYAAVAQELRGKLFSGTGGNGKSEETAKEALRRLQNLVATSKTAPELTARFAKGSQLFFVPLALLSAPGGKVLEGAIEVYQPLPAKRQNQKPTCVAKWNLLIPKALSTTEQPLLDTLATAYDGQSWVSGRFSSIQELKAFFFPSAVTSNLQPGQSEGFVLFSHHAANGNLWFDKEGERVILEDVRRLFPEGSVGFLGACSVGDPTGTGNLVTHLNRQRVDAMVLSPFAVDSIFTLQLGSKFLEVLDEAYRKREQLTMRDVFRFAVARTRTQSSALGSTHWDQEGLEFVFAGNPDIQLCDLGASTGEQARVEP